MKNNNLVGKVIIVAGGSGGIGSDVCKLLTLKGARIIIVGRNTFRASELIAELRLNDSEFVFVEKNLSIFNEWGVLINYVLNIFGHIDILINSIGVITPGHFSDLEVNQIDENIQNNFLSVIYGCKSILPIFKKQGVDISLMLAPWVVLLLSLMKLFIVLQNLLFGDSHYP